MTITETDRGVAQIPRRLGFWVRMRARAGLLPGQVSTAALVQARRYRWLMWWLIPFAVLMILVFSAAIFSDNTRERQVTVVNVFRSTNGEYAVVLDDGAVLDFDDQPTVRPGDRVVERRRRSFAIGLVVDGRYVPATNDRGGTSPTVGLVFGMVWIALVFAVLSPTLIWGRRSYKQIAADLGGPLETTRGRYLGSWVWRGMSMRLFSLQRAATGHVSGFPIAIQRGPDDVQWFAAPSQLLGEVRRFEDQIAGGSRDVIVTFHPATRAIAQIRAADESVSLDLQREVDELHPDSGLQLRVSRRPRKAHLPDL